MAKPLPPVRRNSSISSKKSPHKPIFTTGDNDYAEIQLNRKKLDKIDEMNLSGHLGITSASLNLEISRLKPMNKNQTNDMSEYESLPPPPESFYFEEVNGR